MAIDSLNTLLCYNKGCGKSFDPDANKEDSCTFHPGVPVFHDAYKGWSCCNKKCTDFTEFLNIKGCTKSFHSSEKPREPEKPLVDKSKANDIVEYRAPEKKVSALPRPSFESTLVTLKPDISASLKAQFESLVIDDVSSENKETIVIGTTCKNGGCKATYEGAESTNNTCTHHPGCPIFHEGLKFWSCCQKRTTDFTAFLDQVGCKTSDSHVWIKEKGSDETTACRYDWHQTGSNVIVSIYAKKYDPYKSSVQLNPIRAKVHVDFPQEKTSFDVDWELRGIVDVDKCRVSMTPTKIEIILQKAEIGSWSKLDFPRSVKQEEIKVKVPVAPAEVPSEELVDLSDIY